MHAQLDSPEENGLFGNQFYGVRVENWNLALKAFVFPENIINYH